MSWREIGIPIAVGLVFGLLALTIPEPKGPEPFVPTQEDLGVVFPFETGPRMEGIHGTILVLADHDRPQNVTWQDPPVLDERTGQDVYPPNATAQISWHNDHLGTIDIEPGLLITCIRAPCLAPAAPWIARLTPEDARFDAANQTVGLTLYAFNAAGEVLASNAPARELDRFRISGDFILLGHDPWYLGNGTAPNGSLTLPFGTELAAAALEGLPVGGIATIHVKEHPYEWLVGELWLTGRIDSFS